MYTRGYELEDFNVREEYVEDNTSEFNVPNYGTSFYDATRLPYFDEQTVIYYEPINETLYKPLDITYGSLV